MQLLVDGGDFDALSKDTVMIKTKRFIGERYCTRTLGLSALVLSLGCACSSAALAQSVPANLVGQVSLAEWQEIQGQIRSHATRLATIQDDEETRQVRSQSNVSTLNQTDYVKASNTDAGDQFGFSVAVSGNYMVVGGWLDDSDGLGEDGNPTSNSLIDSGAAYVYVRENGVWRYQAYLKASNPGVNDRFGRSVGISGDTIVVGAYFEDSSSSGINSQPNDSAVDSGAAYVFVYNDGLWQQQAYLKASNPSASDWFGESIAISNDTVAVGARLEDSSTRGINPANNSSATDSGAAYIFVRDNGVWSQQAFIKASNSETGDHFGYSLDIDGDTLVVGAFLEDGGSTVVNGSQGNGSSTDYGAAYVFSRVGGNWSQQAYLKAPNADSGDYFGEAVSVSGDTVAIGAYYEDGSVSGVGYPALENGASNSGAVYLYTRSVTNTWRFAQYIKAENVDANDEFGRELDLSGNFLVVGSWHEDGSNTIASGVANNDFRDAGAAYLYVIDDQDVTPVAYLKASNAGTDDQLSHDVAVSGASVIVGSHGEDSNSTGVNGPLDNNDAMDAGAAYIFSQTASYHPVGGTVVGLAPNNRVLLQNNESNEIAVDENGSFRFGPLYESGTPYAVTVSSHPDSPRQDCMVRDGSGVISSQAIDNIVVDCTLRTLSIDTHLNTVDGANLMVPVHLAPEGESLSGVAFSLDYDAACLNPDADNDGELDQVVFHTAAEFTTQIQFNPLDEDGEIDIAIADVVPPLSSLASDDLVEILFHVNCPETQTTSPVLSPLNFSANPPPSFSNLVGQDVTGTLAQGQARVWAGNAGDCNVTDTVTIADQVSIGLEIFDGDGTDYIDAPEGEFFGSPLGCDANGDQMITAADVSCANILLFGDSCEPLRQAAGDARPEINITPYHQEDRIHLPLRLQGHGHTVAAVAFSLRFDLLQFDPSLVDLDRDGVPDQLSYPQSRPGVALVHWRVDGETAYLDVLLADTAANQLAEGVILDVVIPSANLPSTGLEFDPAMPVSFSDAGGTDLPGIASVGEVIWQSGFEGGQ